MAKKLQVGTVATIWRYPVKSMSGEPLLKAALEKDGLVGDRYWAIRDEDIQETSNVRRLPKLLRCKAQFMDEPSSLYAHQSETEDIPNVQINIPELGSFSSDQESIHDTLSNFLNKKVSLQPLRANTNWRFYRLKTVNGATALKKQFNTKEALPSMASISWRKMMELAIFSTPLGRFYDAYPLHLVTSNSIDFLASKNPEGDFCAERFRPNLYIQSSNPQPELEEFNWSGGKLYIGDCILKCESKTVRCSMPAQPQARIDNEDLNKDSQVLRTLEKQTKRHLGINISIIKTGAIKQGDPVYYEAEPFYALRKIYQPISDPIKNFLIQSSLKLVDLIGKK